MCGGGGGGGGAAPRRPACTSRDSDLDGARTTFDPDPGATRPEVDGLADWARILPDGSELQAVVRSARPPDGGGLALPVAAAAAGPRDDRHGRPDGRDLGSVVVRPALVALCGGMSAAALVDLVPGRWTAELARDVRPGTAIDLV